MQIFYSLQRLFARFTTAALVMLFIAASPTAFAETALEALQSRLQLNDLQRGRFTQEREISLLPVPIRSNGHFLHVRNTGLYWVVEQPFPSELRVRDGLVQERLSTVQPPEDDNQKRNNHGWSAPLLGKQGAQIAANILHSLLAVDLAALEYYFDSHIQLQADQWTLTLLPKNAALGSLLQTVEISGQSKVHQIVMTSPANETTGITLDYDEASPMTEAERRVLVD